MIPLMPTSSKHKATSVIKYTTLAFILYALAPLLFQLPKAPYRWITTGDLLFTLRFDIPVAFVKDPIQHTFPEILPTPLRQHSETILKEYESFRKRVDEMPLFVDLDENQKYIDSQGRWGALFLLVYNTPTCVADYFPETMRLLRESGLDIVTIMFSRMQPHHTIAPHTGPSKLVVRHLMGLKVAEKPIPPYLKVWQCSTCQETVFNFKEGDEIAFDDVFWHMVENPTDEERIALFLDLKRHDIKGWREQYIYDALMWLVRILPIPQKSSVVSNTNKVCARVQQDQ